MIEVKGTTITLTRGDTLRLELKLERNGEEYIPSDNDKVRFAMKRNYSDDEVLILKEINDLYLELKPSDTKHLEYGPYVYDMEITYSDGAVDTFIAGGRLTLTLEVE